jgi:hypothetical protein
VLHSNPRWLLLLLVGLLLTSCESKLSQCQKINRIHNKIVLDSLELSKVATKGDLGAVLKSADVFAQGAQDMKAIDVSDSQLKEIKDQLMVMYQNSSQVTKQIMDSQRLKKNSEVVKGLEQLRQVASPEKNLVDGINNYCRSGSSSGQ